VLALWDDSVFASPEAVLRRINADLRRSPVRLPGGEELVLSISVGGTPVRGRGGPSGAAGEGGRGDVPGQAGRQSVDAH
jgi:hypothetical protein